MSGTDAVARHPAMAWDRLEPPTRAGDVAQRSPLRVQPLQRAEVAVLDVIDDDLPQADGATLVWLEPRAGRWVAWAARLDGAVATPWRLIAERLHLVDPDPSLVRLLGPQLVAAISAGTATLEGTPRPVEPMPRHLACICRERTLESVYRAAGSGWSTVEEVKRRTQALFGECQGRRCEALIAERLDLDPADARARITARPPLVPVPASVLAAFADA